MIFKKRQDTDDVEPVVSIQARGIDVKEVLADLFAQAKLQFMLNSGIEKRIYLSVREVPFTRALQMVCDSANLQYSLQDQVYVIQAAGSAPNPVGAMHELPRNTKPANEQDALRRRVNLNFNQTVIKAIVSSLSRQSGMPIELDAGIPNYRMSAKLPGTTLEVALNAICTGTGLKYTWTGEGFKITRTVSAAAVSPGRVITPVPPKVRPSGEKPNPRTAPVRNMPPSAGTLCPKCKATLEKEWNYCPLCGAWVKPLTQPK